MSKTIFLVYQDCVLCGAHKQDISNELEAARKAKINVVQISFLSSQARSGKFAQLALEAGIASMPYFTDGETFSKTIDAFVTTKSSKKTKKTEEKAETVEETEAVAVEENNEASADANETE